MYAVKSSHIRKVFEDIIKDQSENGLPADQFAAFEEVMELVKRMILTEEVYVSLQEPA